MGGPFQVNSESAGNQTLPSVAINRQGQFVVAWDSEVAGGYDVLARRYESDGTPLGEVIRVNQQLAQARTWPKVAADERFSLIVVWDREGADGNGKGVLVRQFDRDGNPLGDELVVNSTTAGHQSFPVAVTSDRGHMAVIWESRNQDGGGLGVFGQRFIESRPVVDLNGPLAGIDYAGAIYSALPQPPVARQRPAARIAHDVVFRKLASRQQRFDLLDWEDTLLNIANDTAGQVAGRGV